MNDVMLQIDQPGVSRILRRTRPDIAAPSFRASVGKPEAIAAMETTLLAPTLVEVRSWCDSPTWSGEYVGRVGSLQIIGVARAARVSSYGI